MIPGMSRVHPSLQPQTRFVIAATAIAVNRSLGRVNAFDDGLKQADYTNLPDFWEDLLSEPRTPEDFIHYMASFHFSFSPFSAQDEDDGSSVVFDPTWMNHVDLIKITLRRLLTQATQTEDPFVLKAGLIEPRGAVRWLLSMKLRRSLIPVELAQHLEGSKLGVPEPVEPTSTAKPSGAASSTPNVSERDLREFLNNTATRRHTKRELFKLTKEAFRGRNIPRKRLQAAYSALPSNQKRGPGDHERTLNARGG